MRIREWPKHERPRERFSEYGAQALSSAELLAILLGHGQAGLSAVDLARQTLAQTGSLRALLHMDPKQLSQLPGWGPARAMRLLSGVELCRRALAEDLKRQQSLCSPGETREFLKAHLRDRCHEVFVVVFMDNQHRILAVEDLFRGSLDSCSVHPREVIKHALRLGSGAVIVAHNHPSGMPEPSPADKLLTTKLKSALALVDVRLLDHFVVGDGEPVSFAERGWL